MMRNPPELVVALDLPSWREAEPLVERLAGHVRLFKVGAPLFTAEGPRALAELAKRGARVFLDLKFHDIPETVAAAVAAAVRAEVAILDVHAHGGGAMLKAAQEALVTTADRLGTTRPLLLAVTVLTSLTATLLRSELGVERPLEAHVVHLARLAIDAGLDGVVASPQELQSLRRALGPDPIIATPGVRPACASHDDQQRVLGPAAAVAAGATYVIVGRPIIRAPDPVKAAQAIIAEMQNGRRREGNA
ncbi:MAG: orotidine-5'-phosphate decarboxylase [Candidatus Methylomirabilales bacterium]